MTHHGRVDAGQAVVLVLAPIALVLCLALALVDVSNRLSDRSRAQVAANASALAGTIGGRAAAARAAALNDGELVEYQEVVNEVDISVRTVVEVGGQRASARASTEP